MTLWGRTSRVRRPALITIAAAALGGFGVAGANAASCPPTPKIGRSATVSGRVEVMEVGGTIIFFSVKGCGVRVIAPVTAGKSCRRGRTLTASGPVRLYDLYPGMETLYIDAKKVSCG